MAKYLGVVIEDTYLPYDILYYEAPNNFSVSIGDRVLVPLGVSDAPRLGFVLEELDAINQTFDYQIKPIIAVVEKNLFSKEIAELFKFTSNTFLVPMHSLINEIYGTFKEGDLKRIISIKDEATLKDIYENARPSLKKSLIEILLDKKTVDFEFVRGKLKKDASNILAILRDLEKQNLISVSFKIPESYEFFVKVKDENLVKEYIENNKVQNSHKKILINLLKSKVAYAPNLIKGIRNGKSILQNLIDDGLIEKINFEIKPLEDKKQVKLILDGGSLEERSLYLANFLKNNLKENGRALIVVSELSLIEKLKKIYSDNFTESVFAWDGKDKSEIRAYIETSTKIFITTSFALFVEIPNLQFIIVEDTSSKYHLPYEFNMFDTRFVAYKKSTLENCSLIFSTYSLDDFTYYIHKEKGFELIKLKDTKKQNKRIIDMKKEYKSERLSPISSYLESKIRKALANNENIALVLNRKPYSTFIVCRECGYTHKCPVCKSPLYYDSEKNILFCPVCGHTEPPIQICPRCGSISISYLGYGIQKLSKDIEKIFDDAKLVILESNSKDIIYNSKDFNKTIFLGTEFLFSHLTFDNIFFVAFVSADTFFNGSEIFTSIEAFRYFELASFETFPKDIYLQVYSTDNFVIDSFKKDNELGFIKEEINFRKVLLYPPFSNLIVLKTDFPLDGINLTNLFKDSKILGPVKRFYKKELLYEVSIKTQRNPKEFFDKLKEMIAIKNIKGVRVFPTPKLLD